jgi:WhiB family redox-sensing transcriptional regulator
MVYFAKKIFLQMNISVYCLHMLQIKVSTWQYDALCRQHSSNLFFPPATFEKKEDREKREAKAKAVCSGCPVKYECLEEANEISEPFGVWGGLNEVERKRESIYT